MNAKIENNYHELNIAVEFSSAIARKDYVLGYTRLEFFEDNDSDNEFP